MKKAVVIQLLSMWRCFDADGYREILALARAVLTPREITEVMFR